MPLDAVDLEGDFAMTKWTLVPVHFFILEISRRQEGRWPLHTSSFWRFRDGKMGVGPRTLFHFEYSSMTKRMLGPVHFRDDKMGDGLRTLFHFERFAIMAPVRFFVLEILR